MRGAGAVFMNDGVLLLNKHAGVTSHDMIYRVRRAMGTRQVGHAGTLDPMAEGVLVVLVGRAAKACEYLSHDEKRYCARLRLGLTTDTEDIGGQVLTHCDSLPDADTVADVCADFIGNRTQIPPMYSALKVNGQKLCDLARQGITIDRQPRPIRIFSLSCTPTDIPSDYILEVHCSGGTYIRTLCADIGTALHCGGVMAALTRTQACGFSLSDCITADNLDALSPEERQARLLPTESLFTHLPACNLPNFYKTLLRNGCRVEQKKLHLCYENGTLLRLRRADGRFFALGEVVCDPHTGETFLRTCKVFDLDV